MCPGEEAIAAFAAGQLGKGERDALEAHLDHCSECTELVAMLAKLASPRVEATDAASPELAPALADDALLDGQLGRYVLLARIGAGGQGVVYAAYDPELDRRVALKLLRHVRPGAELRDEARAIARLAHPNVVAVHDVGREGDTTFVAMELVDGVDLREWLRARRTPEQIVDVFVQAGRGLAAAHAVGLVHRDVKPSNLVIGRDGRARVLDFGLARDAENGTGGGGTPAYMAPEQARGERVDARADQYALCVALWEALAGERPKPQDEGASDAISGVPDRIVRVLRRGLSPDRDARFATMDDLLAELAPPAKSRTPWIVASGVALVALALAIGFALTRAGAAPTCARAGDPVLAVWDGTRAQAVRAAFTATKLPYATTAADATRRQLDDWAARWRAGAEASCRATSIERVQPPALHALRQACLDQLLEQLRPIVDAAAGADAGLVARANTLVGTLPAPERCADVTALGALPPLPPAEAMRDELAAVRAEIARLEAAVLAGKWTGIADDVARVRARADATRYAPVQARATFLAAHLDGALAHYDASIAKLHAAAQLATGARDLELLAEIWILLAQTLGNDLRTSDQATVFDGYAGALIPQLPDRATLELRLEHARCNRNGDAREAPGLAKRCEAAIALAMKARPPQPMLAAADRVRLGHFQRLAGQGEKALSTLTAARDEAIDVFGAQHPDTAVARYSLGMAEISAQQVDAGLAELREALAIRRAAFPGDNIQTAESLQGLGDALGEAGKPGDGVTYLEDAVAMLDRLHEGESAQAANAHMLLGMTLQELHRDDDAIAHDLRAADIADRSLEHREAIAAMGLRLAATLEAEHDHAATGLAHLERALRLLERGRATPNDLGKTQLDIAQLANVLHDRVRARAMAEAARASFVLAHETEDLPAVDALLRELSGR